MTASVTGNRPTARTLWLAFVTFALFRGGLFVFDYVGVHLIPRVATCRPQWEPLGPDHEFWNGFFRWDGGWYRNIVLNGYVYHPKGASSTAFYPLFPYAARWLGVVIGNPFVAGLVISNAGTVGGLYHLIHLGERFFDDTVTDRAVVFLLVFPTSFFLSSFYTEGVFFFFAAASMRYFYADRYVASGVYGGLSMLSRSSGLVLFAALAADAGLRVLRRQTRFRFSMLGLLLIPAGLGVFMLILQHQVGDPLAFMKVMSNWGRERTLPWVPLIDAFSTLTPLLPEHFEPVQRVLDATTAVAFLGIGTAMFFHGFPIGMSAFVVVGVLLPLSTANLAGMGRYVLSLFPAFFWLAKVVTDRPRLERFLTFGFAFFLAVYSLRFMRCGWAG